MATTTPSDLRERVHAVTKCVRDVVHAREIAVAALSDLEEFLEHDAADIDGLAITFQCHLEKDVRDLNAYLEHDGNSTCFQFEDLTRSVDEVEAFTEFTINYGDPIETRADESRRTEAETRRRAANAVRRNLDLARGPALDKLEEGLGLLHEVLHPKDKPDLSVVGEGGGDDA